MGRNRKYVSRKKTTERIEKVKRRKRERKRQSKGRELTKEQIKGGIEYVVLLK